MQMYRKESEACLLRPRNIWEIYGTYLGNIWEIYGKYMVQMYQEESEACLLRPGGATGRAPPRKTGDSAKPHTSYLSFSAQNFRPQKHVNRDTTDFASKLGKFNYSLAKVKIQVEFR